MKLKKRNAFRLVWFTVVVVFTSWMWSTYQSRGLPPDMFENDDRVAVIESEDVIAFIPSQTTRRLEVIFFQGGLTDPQAYAPLCRSLAEDGFACHLIKMDWRMPQWDYEKIVDLFDLEGGRYVIGGHSQGAKMAAQFVYEHPNTLHGLFLMGTSHPRDFSLADRTLPTVKLYAEFDGLASVSEVMENKPNLPKQIALIEIKGGNHSQFGYLGTLLTDETATISLEEQQRLTYQALSAFLIDVETKTDTVH